MFHTAPKDMMQNAKPIEWPKSLAHFFDEAADKPWGETGPALTDDQKVLINESGNKLQDEKIFSASNPYNPKSQEEKREKEKRDFARSSVGGLLNVTIDQAIDRLSDYSTSLKSFANVGSDYFLRPLDQDDLLRIRDGRIISAAEDPEGRYIVRTAEEKAAFEDANGMCVGGLTLDEITLNENGEMINASEFLIQEKIDDRIQTIDQAVEDLEAGKITVEELPSDLQDIVLGADEGLLPPAPEENAVQNQPVVFAQSSAPTITPQYTPSFP